MTILELISMIIGFVTVLLIMSMLVTALVQASLAIFRSRARNLEKGLLALFDRTSEGSLKEKKTKVNNLLKTQGIDVTKQAIVTNAAQKPIVGSALRIIDRAVGSAVSYIEPEKIKKALNDMTELSKDEINNISKGIDNIWVNIENMMKKRFKLITSILSIIWAVIVAFWFQLSTPQLLTKLSTDSAFLNSILKEAVNIEKDQGGKLDLYVQYQDISGQALNRLAKKYSNYSEKLEEVNGIGADKAALIEELKMVLEEDRNDEKKKKMIKYYNKQLDELYEESREKSIERVQEITASLAQINIIPWQFGDRFYSKDGKLQQGNIFGVLLTAVLLSLGAPFWYDRLKDLLKWRDLLNPKK